MKIPRRRSAAVPFLILPIVCLALAACGSSGNSSTASVSQAAATSSGTGSGPAGAGAGHFAALRSCLQKQGITLPQRPAGSRPQGGAAGGGGVFGGGGGTTGPAGAPGGGRGFFGGATGANATKLRAALAKCGFTPRTGATGAGGGVFRQRFNSAAAKTALTKFASCMRSNGVDVPAPNTSGNGPLFNDKGLDTTSAAFKAAETKCLPDLKGVFPGGFGARGATGSSGASTNNAS